MAVVFDHGCRYFAWRRRAGLDLTATWWGLALFFGVRVLFSALALWLRPASQKTAEVGIPAV